MPHVRRLVVPLALAVLLAITLVACGKHPADPSVDPAQVDATAAPDIGACRVLTPVDVAQPSNATRTVACSARHTAQTFTAGSLPARFEHASYDDKALSTWAYDTCARRFIGFTGADQSLAMRTILSWVWFRPSLAAWGNGARWYRCDVVGGGAQTKTYVDLPEKTKGLLLGTPDDRWLVCALGRTVSGSVKVPCSTQHDWRAVTTIVLGGANDPYPGDHVSQVRTRDFCSKSVGAWLGYPVDYDYGYSWFHQAEWDAGNRRSVCWARTSA